MKDARLEKLAKVLVGYSIGVKKGDLVLITGAAVSEAAVVEVCREVVRAGGHPWVRMTSEAANEAFLKEAADFQLGYVNPIDKTIISKVNARIVLWGTENSRSASNIDPARQAKAAQGRKPMLGIHMKRCGLPANHKNFLRWVGTGVPTNAFAQEAEMSLAEYEDFVFGAGKLNARDPVAAWKKLGEAQERMVDFLDKASEVRFRTPNGTDVRVGVEGRTWINCAGRRNFPDGEVFTSPIEDATEGEVRYTLPAVYNGIEVENIRLVFKAGKVVDCSAAKNEPFLTAMLDQDKGARILGEIAIGTNYDIQKYTKNTLFDEKIGGTFHAAVGAAIPAAGGRNKSGLHWDMVCDLRAGGTIEADGTVISRNGRFTNRQWPRPT